MSFNGFCGFIYCPLGKKGRRIPSQLSVTFIDWERERSRPLYLQSSALQLPLDQN